MFISSSRPLPADSLSFNRQFKSLLDTSLCISFMCFWIWDVLLLWLRVELLFQRLGPPYCDVCNPPSITFCMHSALCGLCRQTLCQEIKHCVAFCHLKCYKKNLILRRKGYTFPLFLYCSSNILLVMSIFFFTKILFWQDKLCNFHMLIYQCLFNDACPLVHVES